MRSEGGALVRSVIGLRVLSSKQFVRSDPYIYRVSIRHPGQKISMRWLCAYPTLIWNCEPDLPASVHRREPLQLVVYWLRIGMWGACERRKSGTRERLADNKLSVTSFPRFERLWRNTLTEMVVPREAVFVSNTSRYRLSGRSAAAGTDTFARYWHCRHRGIS